MSRRKPTNQTPKAKPTAKVLNLAQTEIPQPWTDREQAKKGRDKSIPFGRYNLFPQETAELFRESPTLHSVITSKASYFAGQGLEYENGSGQYVNPRGDSHSQLLSNIGLDKYLGGNSYVLIERIGGTTHLYHMDQVKVRMHAEQQVVAGKYYDKYIICNNWAKVHAKGTKTWEVCEYPVFKKVEGKKGEYALLHIRDYEPSFDFYGLPNWIGAIFYAKLESLIGRWNVNHFDNGLFSSGILNLPADGMTDEEVEKLTRQIISRLTGTETGNNGKLLITTGSENAPTFTEVSRQFEGSFLDLKNICEDTIVSACSWKRSLAGLATEGQLGNNQQILNEYQVAMRDIERDRAQVLPALDAVAAEFGLWGEYKIIDSAPIKEADTIMQGQQIQQVIDVVRDPEMNEVQKLSILTTIFCIDEETASEMIMSN